MRRSHESIQALIESEERPEVARSEWFSMILLYPQQSIDQTSRDSLTIRPKINLSVQISDAFINNVSADLKSEFNVWNVSGQVSTFF